MGEMNTHYFTKFFRYPVFMVLSVFLGLMVLSQALTYQRYLLVKDEQMRELAGEANLAKERLQTVMAGNFSATQTLGFITENYGMPANFDSVARQLLLVNKYVDIVELVKGGIITKVYPLKGNEDVIGYNILGDSLRNSGAFKAIKTGKFFIAGPIQLKQGGVAIVGRQPIFVKNKFWGFAATVTYLSTLINAAAIDTSGRGKFIYQLVKVNSATGEEEGFLPNYKSVEAGYSVPVEVPNGEWKLYVASKTGMPLATIINFSLLGFILSLTGGLFAWFIAGQPAKLNLLVAEKTEQIEHEQRLSDSIINSLPGVFYMADVNGKLLRWNRNFETVSGYSPDEIRSMRVIDFVDVDEKQALLQKKQLAIDKGISDAETGFLTKQKEKIPYFFTSLLTSYNQQPCLVGIGVDITERKKAEQELRESELKYRSLVEQATDVICIADENLRFIDINTAGCNMFGYTRDEFLRLSPADIFFSEDLAASPIRIEELRAGKSVSRESRFRRKDGAAVLLEASAKMLEDGRFIIFARDISERRRAELAIIESEEKYRSLIESSPDIIMRLDLDEKVRFINYTDGGFKQEDIIGVSAYEFVLPEYHELVRQAHHKVMATKVAESYETKALGADGKTRWFQTNVGPIIINGEVTGVTLISRNITDKKRAEEEIVREKVLSESLINSLPGVFYLYDEQGKFMRWNKNFEAVTGYTGEELKTMNPLDFFEGEDKTLLTQRVNEVFTYGEAEVEAMFRNKAGEKIPYYFNGMSIMYEGKRCLIGVGIDITARKEAEENLAKQERQFRETMDNMLEGVQIFDADYRCVYVNNAVEKQGPYSKEETLGRSLMENYPGIENTELFKIFEQCRNEGISKHIEHEFTFPDGSTKWFELSIQPNPEGLFVLSADITERRNAEQEILASEEKYRYLFNNNPTVIIIWELKTLKVMEVNEQAIELYGYTRDEFIGLSILSLRPEEDRQKIKDFAQKLLMTEPDRERRIWRHLKKDGGMMHMDITSHRIDYNGEKAILSLGKDITEQLKAEEELKKTYANIRLLNAHLQTVREDERTRIAREIHDELGQQLTGLKMDACWINKKLVSADTAVSEKLENMIVLIDDTVKTVRRISSDLRPGVLDDLGLVAALEWQSTEFEKRTGIICHFSSTLAEFDLDRTIATGVFRVFQETLTNVARHARATEIKASLQKPGGNLLLTISDNGVGFNVKDAQGNKTLGLIGMKERALMMGGELTIESEPGKGATVILRVPVVYFAMAEKN